MRAPAFPPPARSRPFSPGATGVLIPCARAHPVAVAPRAPQPTHPPTPAYVRAAGASHDSCRQLWGLCTDAMAQLKLATLPSRRRFRARIADCNQTLAACVGPAGADFHERLHTAATVGAQEYTEHFLARISQLLVLGCIGGILLFRYVFVSSLAEIACWALLLSSEVLPRLNALANLSPVVGGGASATTSFWDTAGGSALLTAYEFTVYNDYADAEDWMGRALVLLAAAVGLRKCYACCSAFCGWDGKAARRRRREMRRLPSRRYRGRTPRQRSISEQISDDEDDYEETWDSFSPECTMPTSASAPLKGGPARGGGTRHGRALAFC